MKSTAIVMTVVLMLCLSPLCDLQAQTDAGPQQYFVKLIRYNVAKIKWDDIEQYGPFPTPEEAGRVAEETLRTFRIIDGYSTEIIHDAAAGKDGVKRIDEFHPFNIKIPELIVSKTKPADPATLKKNFVMWLEEDKNGKWEAVPNRRFEYSNITVKDFQKKLETYKAAVASENKKAIRLAAEKVAQKQVAGRPVRYQVKWEIAPALIGTVWAQGVYNRIVFRPNGVLELKSDHLNNVGGKGNVSYSGTWALSGNVLTYTTEYAVKGKFGERWKQVAKGVFDGEVREALSLDEVTEYRMNDAGKWVLLRNESIRLERIQE